MLSRPQGKFLYDLKDMSYSASNDGLAEWMLSVILLTGPFISLAQSVVTKLILKKSRKVACIHYNWSDNWMCYLCHDVISSIVLLLYFSNRFLLVSAQRGCPLIIFKSYLSRFYISLNHLVSRLASLVGGISSREKTVDLPARKMYSGCIG